MHFQLFLHTENYQIYISRQGLFPDFQSHIPNCLIYLLVWMANGQLSVNIFNPELLRIPPKAYPFHGFPFLSQGQLQPSDC